MLLRGLSVQPQVRAMVLEDHVSSAASIRSCLSTAGTSTWQKGRRIFEIACYFMCVQQVHGVSSNASTTC